MRFNKSSLYSSIKLSSDQAPNQIQILRTGKFNHPQYGAFEITVKTLAEMKVNFDNKIRGIDMAFDYFHDSDKEASGWVKELMLKENGSVTELWAMVDWTPKAQRMLAERELRYFSPDFAFNWTDPETGTKFSNVLFGGGLTNRPFVKEMMAIVADETKTGENTMTLEQALARVKELEAAKLKLSEDAAKLAAAHPPAQASDLEALKKQIADLQAENAKLKSDNEMAMAEKKKADEAKMMAEKETAFTVLLTEGKACVAQKDAYLKGDMNEFIKLAQPLNLKPAGSSGTKTPEEITAAEIIKLAEEKQKLNPKLSRGDALSIAKKELGK